MRDETPQYHSLTAMTKMSPISQLEGFTGLIPGVYNEAWLPPSLSLSDDALTDMANRFNAPFPMGTFTVGCSAFLQGKQLLLDGYRRLAMVLELARGDRLAYSLATHSFTTDFDAEDLGYVPSQVLLDTYKLFHHLKNVPEGSRLHLEGLSAKLRNYKGFYAFPCLLDGELAQSLGRDPVTPTTLEEELELASALRDVLTRR